MKHATHIKRNRTVRSVVIYALLILVTVSLSLNLLGIYGKIDLQTLKNTQGIEPIMIEHETVIKDIEVRYIDREIPLFFDAEQNQWRVFEITGYILNDPDTIQGTNDIVATGIDMDEYNTRNIPAVAVDPKIIPLYSIVEIEGMGAYIALDTGGMIKGNRIDILFETKQKALEFGRRDLRVRIIK